MLIVCPNCATSYQVEPASLGASGRSVRCVRCKKTWFAGNPQAFAAIARSHREDLSALAAPAAAPAPPPVPPAVPATAGDAPLLDAAPPTVPEPEPSPPVAPEPALSRDDRGPAPARDADSAPTVALAAAPPTVPESPADLEPSEEASEPQPAGPPPSHDIESVARRTRRLSRKRASGMRRWTTPILALVALNTGLIAWRAEIVRVLPQMASFYAAIHLPVNLRELVFSEIVSRTEQQDGVPMLLVEGIIKSESRRTVDVPRLRFALRNVGGQEIYAWTALPTQTMLPPGGTLSFRTRLASPPPEAHAVLVRFFTRRDLVAGIQ